MSDDYDDRDLYDDDADDEFDDVDDDSDTDLDYDDELAFWDAVAELNDAYA